MQQKNIIEYDTPIKLAFVKKWHEYEDVYTFAFKPSGKLPFRAGQNARIVIPELPEAECKRSLSFASTPDEDTVLFSMHTASESAYKAAMLALNEGDVVHLVKIKGHTVLPDDKQVPVVCIAGGIGVTPFRSILFHLHTHDYSTRAVLVHVSKSAYLYEDELTQLPYEQHRIRKNELVETITAVVQRYPGARYYIAGPPSFLTRVQSLLSENDVSEEQIVSSRFTGYEDRED